MGFFDRLKKQPLKVDDQQLLLEAMLCVAFADGDDQYEETNLVRAFANTLPELKNADAYEVYEKAEKAVKLHGAMTRVKVGSSSTSSRWGCSSPSSRCSSLMLIPLCAPVRIARTNAATSIR